MSTTGSQIVLTYGNYLFRQQAIQSEIMARMPPLFELLDQQGRVYAVTEDKDWLLALMHRLQGPDLQISLATFVAAESQPFKLIKARCLLSGQRVLFEYYEVWNDGVLWGRFPTQQMADQVMTGALQ